MMTLLEKQVEFMRAVGRFLSSIDGIPATKDIALTAGDFFAHDGHRQGSCHYLRLAMDLNLFVDGKYIRAYEEAPEIWDSLGAAWKVTHPLARWGGDFAERDLNHFSFEHGGMK